MALLKPTKTKGEAIKCALSGQPPNARGYISLLLILVELLVLVQLVELEKKVLNEPKPLKLKA